MPDATGTLSACAPRPANAADLAARALADRAAGLLRPLIESLIADRDASFDRALHVVVMNPHAEPSGSFEEAILACYEFGNAGNADVDYGCYARDKARYSFRERADTSELCDRMTGAHGGGARPLVGGVYRNGWAIGVSGAQPWIDEAIGNILADLLRALALQHLLTEA